MKKDKYTSTSTKALRRKVNRFFKREPRTPLYVEIVLRQKTPSRENLMDIIEQYKI